MRLASDRFFTAMLLIAGPLAFISVLGPWAERFFPVVDPFVIEDARCGDRGCTEISGWMQKRRECQFVEIYARIPPQAPGQMSRIVEVRFLDRQSDHRLTRPVDRQHWGPWYISTTEKAQRVEIHVTHKCTPFWLTKSVLTVFDAPQSGG